MEFQETQNPSPKPQIPSPNSPTITRFEPNNPYPTTFVQADSSSFKQVVQMLTGSTHRTDQAKNPIQKPVSKLFERRNSLKSFKINPLLPGYPIRPEILSPSVLNFPSLALSPVTPLVHDPFTRIDTGLDMVAEEEAISKKGYFLHPSPASTPRDSEPRLLPLFPLTSPR